MTGIPAPLPPDVIEAVMAYGHTIERELERLIGSPVVFAIALAVEKPGALVMHRMTNSNIDTARKIFALAGATPVDDELVQRLHEH
jgi:hypothetical protein